MIRIATALFCTVAVLWGAGEPALGAATGSDHPRAESPHAPDHILVELAAGADAAEALGEGSEVVVGRWRTQEVPQGMSAADFVEEVSGLPGIVGADLDYQVSIDLAPAIVTPTLALATTANDPFSKYQWNLSAIQAEPAWAKSTVEGVVFAVVDTGVSVGGEDLLCHTMVAPFNAITETAGLFAAADDHGHGTHVAGTIAQCTNNDVGVAGVAFDGSLMPVKVLDDQGSGWVSDVVLGIEWARSHGADVINLSLGGSVQSGPMDSAIEQAVAEDIVIVAASGNNGGTSVSYPASHPDVIAVGATDFNNQRAPYSNGGSALDLVAPGGHVSQDANSDGHPDGVLQETICFLAAGSCPPSLAGGNGWGYYFFQGTSMAAPHVSGAAALLLARSPGLDPGIVKHILESTALDLGPSGFDNAYGHGLIQIEDALDFASIGPSWPAGAVLKVVRHGERSLTLGWSAATDDIGVDAYRIRVAGTTGRLTTSREATFDGLEPGRRYTFEVLARDGFGNWSESLKAVVRTSRVFDDTGGHTFSDDILWMSAMDITRGCNPPLNDLFCPDDPVTRAQMAAFLVRALGLVESSHSGFVDVAPSSTFAADVGRLATAGITKGCTPPLNDLFCPDDPVTRAQMAAFLVRALGLVESSHSGFVDVAPSSTFAADVGRLATAGITLGCDPPENDRFCPDDPVTRGQLAAFLKRALG